MVVLSPALTLNVWCCTPCVDIGAWWSSYTLCAHMSARCLSPALTLNVRCCTPCADIGAWWSSLHLMSSHRVTILLPSHLILHLLHTSHTCIILHRLLLHPQAHRPAHMTL